MTERKTQARPDQANVRLTPEEKDILAAAAFIEESSASEIVRRVVVAFLEQQMKDPQIQLALRALEERRGVKTGRVTSLRKTSLGPPSDA